MDYTRRSMIAADNTNVFTDLMQSNATYSKTKYSMKYRLTKTFLMILTWICFGLNFEMIGITLEDLRVYLDVNYAQISFGLVLRNVGYLSLTLLFGLVFEKIAKYSDSYMAISSALIGLSLI